MAQIHCKNCNAEFSDEALFCRYGIITTNAKSLYFQGVHAFTVI